MRGFDILVFGDDGIRYFIEVKEIGRRKNLVGRYAISVYKNNMRIQRRIAKDFAGRHGSKRILIVYISHEYPRTLNHPRSKYYKPKYPNPKKRFYVFENLDWLDEHDKRRKSNHYLIPIKKRLVEMVIPLEKWIIRLSPAK